MSRTGSLIRILLIAVLGIGVISPALQAVEAKKLEKLLSKTKTYDFGDSRAPLSEIADVVQLSHDNSESKKQIEQQFIKFLQSKATLAGKQFICRQLSLIGSEAAVPTLGDMLTYEKTADIARFALERIPGEAVGKALANALDKTSEKVKLGIINSLGQRGTQNAVIPISELIYAQDAGIAEASAAALGKIGGPVAAKELKKAFRKTKGELYERVADSYLKCADGFLANGQKQEALSIYTRLYNTTHLLKIRVAALRGRLLASGNEATEIFTEALRQTEPEIRTAAISLVREIPGREIVEISAQQLDNDNLDLTGKIQLLTALAGRGDKTALPAVAKAARNTDAEIRIAAFKALGTLGDATVVDLLSKMAAHPTESGRKTARESLCRLRGCDVDEKIIASIPKTKPEVKIELIISAGKRNICKAVDTLLKTAQDSTKKVRLESLKALKVIAQPKHLSALVDILVKTEDSATRKEAEKTIVAVAYKIAEKNKQADAVLAKLPSVQNMTTRVSLISVLGKIGADTAIPVLRNALKQQDAKLKDAAIRAFSDWPRPAEEPMQDLANVVQTTDNKMYRALALRGYVRLLGLESKRPADETVRMYEKAMSLTDNISEKKMVLSGLANIKAYEAIEMAANYLGNAELNTEAEMAIVKIAYETHGKDNRKAIKQIVKKIFETTTNNSVREQADKTLKQM